ncbi:MAG: SHOCT domain-containing protein [Thermoleophilia bacterium]
MTVISAAEPAVPRARLVRKLVLQFVGLGGFCMWLTMLSLGMRSVMDVGGSCASGGPFVSAQPCPSGAWVVPVAIWLGLLSLGLYLLGNLPQGPHLAALAWPALFLTLGWNFLDYGIHNGGAGSAGMLVCAVVFGLMGGLPLLVLRDPKTREHVLLGDDGLGRQPPPAVPRPVATATRSAARGARVVLRPRGAPRATPAEQPTPGGRDADLVSRLERLAAMRDRGILTDMEFQEAKRQLLDEPRGG